MVCMLQTCTYKVNITLHLSTSHSSKTIYCLCRPSSCVISSEGLPPPVMCGVTVCQNNGTCHTLSQTCICPPEYTGHSCEVPITGMYVCTLYCGCIFQCARILYISMYIPSRSRQCMQMYLIPLISISI